MTIKTKRILEWIIFSFLALVLIISGSLLYYQQAYAGKIYRGVKVAGIDLSGKTKKQAETLLTGKANNILQKDLVLTAGDQKASLKVSDTGLNFDTAKIVANSYSIGRNQDFFKQLYFSAKTVFVKSDVAMTTSLDTEKFDGFVSEKIPGLSIEPKNAELKITNGVISEVAESNGQVVNSEDLTKKIIALSEANDTAQSFTIPLSTEPIAPKIVVGNLASARATAEVYIAKSVTLTYEDKSYKPTRADIGSWIFFSPVAAGYQAGLDDNSIKTYLVKIAKNFEIQKIDKKISAVDNSILDGGREGKYLDKDKALSEIKRQIVITNSITVAMTTTIEPPKEIKVFPAEGIVPGRFQGKYVDVDLASQKLCMIETNDILGCYTISSGKASTPTPIGTRYIQGKDPKAWSAPYGLYMPWWQSMGGGYGLHELPEWPNGYKEGEAHLGIPVSHGCVRLGVGPAKLLYDWTEIGTPVYIHK